jgi:hypothetical protein
MSQDKEVNASLPIGQPVRLHCPNCGKSGQLRVWMPAVFAIDPSGRPPGYNPQPVSIDGPDRKDQAFCAAEGCEWLGQYRDLERRPA